MGWRFSGLPFDFQTFVQAPRGQARDPAPDRRRRRELRRLCATRGDGALRRDDEDSAIALSGPARDRSRDRRGADGDELGGPKVSGAQSGNAHLVVDDEHAAIAAIQRVLTYLPDSADHARPGRTRRPARRDAERAARRSCPATRAAATTCARCSRRSSTRTASSRGRAATAPACSAALARLEGEAVGRRREPADAAGGRDGRAGARRRTLRSSTSATPSTSRSCSCRTFPG